MRISTTDPMTLNDVTDNAIAADMQAELATLARSLQVLPSHVPLFGAGSGKHELEAGY